MRFAVVAVVLVIVALVARVVMQRPPVRTLAFYRTGHAIMSVEGRPPSTLDLAANGAYLFTPGGSLLDLAGPGWHLELSGPYSYGTGARPQENESRGSIRGMNPTRTEFFDTTVCTFVYTEIMTTRFAGTVQCRGLVWLDSSIENIQRLDLPPFDLDVTFEATGDGTVPSVRPTRRPD
jgi:hypothetical protein